MKLRGSSSIMNRPRWSKMYWGWIFLTIKKSRGWDDLGERHWNMYNIIYETRHQSKFNAQYWMLGAGALGRPRRMVWGGKREEGSGWGTRVYLWRIHFNIWQNQYNIVKLKNKIKLKKKTGTKIWKCLKKKNPHNWTVFIACRLPATCLTGWTWKSTYLMWSIF